MITLETMCLYRFWQQGMKRSGSFTVGTYSIVLKKKICQRTNHLKTLDIEKPPLVL